MHREVFKANNPGRPLRVYFLTYANSVEEQRYRTSVRREKEAFESLIKEKASMVLPSDPASLAAEAHSQAAAAAVAAFGSAPRDSRAGGARALAAAAAGREQVVIVDTREFRSSLPSILHARNMRLVPVTLEVGDYILSPVRRTTSPRMASWRCCWRLAALSCLTASVSTRGLCRTLPWSANRSPTSSVPSHPAGSTPKPTPCAATTRSPCC